VARIKKVKGNAAVLQAVGSTPAKIKESRGSLKAYCDREGLSILHTIDFCTHLGGINITIFPLVDLFAVVC
jgi:hypothetical protein